MKTFQKIIFATTIAALFMSSTNLYAKELFSKAYNQKSDFSANQEPLQLVPLENVDSSLIINDKFLTRIEELSQPEPVLEPPVVLPFYHTIAEKITADEIETLARLVYLEARDQSFEGQKAVVEVVFNRVLSDEFPETIDKVIYQRNQFSPAYLISRTTPNQEQYDAVKAVLSEVEPVLDIGVLYFAMKQYNGYLYAKIEDHYFCYSELYMKQ